MSISTLKKKAGVKYGKISGKKNVGFSLNNPRRVDSKSGRGRTQTQTPFKGSVPRGHGGCCGSYKNNIVNSQYTNPDSFDTIRPSVKNTNGMISTKYKWIKRGYPHAIVQDLTPSDYMTFLENKKSQVSTVVTSDAGLKTCDLSCKTNKPVVYSKEVNTMSSSEYMATRLRQKNCIPPTKEKAPYPHRIQRNSSFVSVPDITYEEYLEQLNKNTGTCS